MSDILQVQSQLGTQLVSSLDNIVTNSKDINKAFENQLSVSIELQKAVVNLSENFKLVSNKLCNASSNFNEITKSESFKKIFNVNSQDLNKECKKATEKLKESSSTGESLAKDLDKLTEKRNKETRQKRVQYKNRIIAFKETNRLLIMLDKSFIAISDSMKSLTKKFKETPLVKRALKTRGLSLIIDIPRMIIVNAFKVVGSLIGATTNFFKTVISLPLMVASIAVRYGNAFREDIVENIGNAYQATKEYSDSTSLLGKGIKNLRNISVGSLKTFENPRSQMVKLFGSGVAGAQKFLTDVAKSIDEMGMLAEIFGYQVSNSTESAMYLTYAKKSLGLSGKEIAYYALDAGTHLENIFTRLDNARESIEHAAKMHGVDTKQVSQGMQKLRTNIKDFGHLTDQSLSNLVARMRQLNVSADDLTSVFSKFKSLEDASKASAMLFQSFEMNVDALDLLTAKDPGKIVDSLRDAMLATGRSYEELNRHEKQLMQQTTGMNDAMLKSLMTYRNMGLSYEEARQKIANDDPTKKQIKAIKGLTSSITEIQKVMNFTSPFQAFMKGLSKNIHGSKKAKEMATSLSNMYETIYLFGLHLDEGIIRQITTPVVAIVRKIDEVFKSPKFKSILRTGTEIISSLTSSAAGEMNPNTAYREMVKSLEEINAMESSGSKEYNKDKAKLKSELLKTIGSQNSKELIDFLSKKNVLTKDGKFIKGITLNKILLQLKSASLEMSSTEGKEAILKINSSVRSNVDKMIGDYFKFDNFRNSRGVKGQIKNTTEKIESMFNEGSGLFGTMFDLGRNILGGIIKGTAIAFTVFLRILNGTINDLYDNASGPLTDLIKNSIGYKEGQEFSILNWLGISFEDSNQISESLSESLRGAINSAGTLFSAGSLIAKKMYSMFGELAKFLIKHFAVAITTVIDNSNVLTKAAAGTGFFIDMTKVRSLAGKEIGKGGLESVIAETKRVDESNKGFFNSQRFSGTETQIDEIINKFRIDNGYRNSNNKYSSRDGYPYGERFKAYDDWLLDTYKTNWIWKFSVSEQYMQFWYSMHWLRALHEEMMLNKILPAIEFEKLKNILISNHDHSMGPPDINRIDKYLQNASTIVLSQAYNHNSYKTMDSKFNKRINDSIFANYLDEEEANKSFRDYANELLALKKTKPMFNAESFINAYPVQDGLFSELNSILSSDGFKLFTEDGKVIVPDSLDELATLSDGNKASLINLFSSAANAYKQAAIAVAVISNTKTIARSSDDYDASPEKIDEMINLFYETLDICINRDVKVNKQVVF